MMKRTYLQSPVSALTLQLVRSWSERMADEVHHSHAVWVVIDGAILGATDLQALQDAYDLPVRAFDGTALATYEEMGLLLWPWHALHVKDELAVLTTLLGARPAVSFVRANAGSAQPLSRMLVSLASAVKRS